MAALATVSAGLLSWLQALDCGMALRLAGAATEGQEVRFGGPLSALFADARTLTSTGAVNAMHDSFTPLGGGLAMVNMMLGEVAPGGVGGLHAAVQALDRAGALDPGEPSPQRQPS
jgi:K+-transporting ATPase ATPase A chain